jgi:amino-acid N-acetyltransferase
MIRKATPADVPTLQAIIGNFVTQGDVLPRTLDELESLIDTCFVAVHEGEIVGTAILEIYSRKLAEVRSLCVLPTVQGKGYGKKLVTACLELARDQGVLEVMAITRSEKFFNDLGFGDTLPNMRKAVFISTRDEHMPPRH